MSLGAGQISLATVLFVSYPDGMNELIESGDPRAKVVGKRRVPAAGTAAALARFDQIQHSVHQMWKTLPFPKGVHRFKTEEEFDSWKTSLMMRQSPARRTPATSSTSAGN
jgi:hypothetical protein